jgi:heptosyltransferase I
MNILIVRLSAIGDVIHTLPALHALRMHFPEAQITWLVEEAAAELLHGHPALDRVLIFKRKRWLAGLYSRSWKEHYNAIIAFIRELRDTQYDLVIAFQSLFKSGLLISLARGQRKIGFNRGMEHAEYSYLFFNERIPPVDMNQHAIQRNLMLLEAIGIPIPEITYQLPLYEPEQQAARNLLAQSKIDPAARLIALHPGTRWTSKQWSSPQFAALGDQLYAQLGAHLIFTGSPTDLPLIQEIMRQMHTPAYNLAGATSLKTLAAIFTHVQTLVAPDTGPLHLATAVGTPVVALFGPTAPWRTGPYGPQHQVIRGHVPCSPCFKRTCVQKICMARIQVQDVLEGVARMSKT